MKKNKYYLIKVRENCPDYRAINPYIIFNTNETGNKYTELTNKELKWILFDLHNCNNSESVNFIKMYNKIIGKLEEILNEKE